MSWKSETNEAAAYGFTVGVWVVVFVAIVAGAVWIAGFNGLGLSAMLEQLFLMVDGLIVALSVIAVIEVKGTVDKHRKRK